ncbi:hypothetical protein C8R47DRAFT_1141531 [Mycena vitilis]|nr:hypothetical protein C8R47DRAFT_1141531 [Mycena vitilis]
MLARFSLTLALGAASALALTINAPTTPTSGGTTSITWSSTSTDPVFSIELNHPSFNSAFAIANNVNPADNNATVVIPPVPAEDNYTLTFVNVTNIDDVFATSPSFSIAAATSASASVTGSASGVGASASGSAIGSATGSASASKASATAPSSSGSGSASSSAPSSSSTTNGAPSSSFGVPASALAAFAAAALLF